MGNPEHTDWNLLFWEILILKIYRYTGSSRRSCGVLSANGKRLVEGERTSSSFSLFLTIWNFLRSILPPSFTSLHSFFFKVCSDMKRLNSITEWRKASKTPAKQTHEEITLQDYRAIIRHTCDLLSMILLGNHWILGQ